MISSKHLKYHNITLTSEISTVILHSLYSWWWPWCTLISWNWWWLDSPSPPNPWWSPISWWLSSCNDSWWLGSYSWWWCPSSWWTLLCSSVWFSRTSPWLWCFSVSGCRIWKNLLNSMIEQFRAVIVTNLELMFHTGHFDGVLQEMLVFLLYVHGYGMKVMDFETLMWGGMFMFDFMLMIGFMVLLRFVMMFGWVVLLIIVNNASKCGSEKRTKYLQSFSL